MRRSVRVLAGAVAGLLVLLVLGVAVAPAALEGRAEPGPVTAAGGVAVDARMPLGPAGAPAPRLSRPADARPRAAPDAPAARRAAAAAAAVPAAPPLTDPAAVAAAHRWAASRRGTVGFAVLAPSGPLRGRLRARSFPSASVSKAMLLVAVLRRAGGRELTPAERALTGPMVTLSDNDAADAVFAQVGDPGLQAVARAAGMRSFGPAGAWSEAGLTPADQARFFLRLDRLLPPRHRAYARDLLSGIVPWQRWGIPAVVARRPGATVLFKGGWRKGLTHQAALVERGGRRLALAVMTEGGPSMAYDEETIAGIARRVLIPAARG